MRNCEQKDTLLGQSEKFAEAVAHYGGIPALRPNKHWKDVLERFHHKAFNQCRTAEELIAFATENNGFVIYRLVDSPVIGQVIDGYLAWLDRFGCSIDSLPKEIAESPFASRKVVCERRGRNVSTSFLWHLCIASRLRKAIPKVNRILEIGPGFGGLTRIMKLLSPGSCYILVDLPESLVFAYVYLKYHFPDAKIMFMTGDKALAADWAEKFDIVLVPSNLMENLRGISVDLALNIASFGEMTTGAVSAYVKFIEESLNTGWLYSINQYGKFPAAMANGRGKRLVQDDICRIALPVDAFWRIEDWKYLEDNGFVQTDLLMAPCLEVLLRRLSPAKRNGQENKALAKMLTVEAKSLPEGSVRWHYLLWDACRLDPHGEGAFWLASWGRSMEYPEFL